MVNILCEAASGEMAIAAAIGAGVVAGAKGLQLVVGHVRGRNGNGKKNGCCHGTGCERLARVETKQEGFEKWLEKVERKLDKVLESK
jgi:hypothetical protein